MLVHTDDFMKAACLAIRKHYYDQFLEINMIMQFIIVLNISEVVIECYQ